MVADTGIGIAPDNQERIFRQFQQVDSSSTRRHEGTGLGLALTQQLLELQGGSIWLRARWAKGVGSARLPLCVPPTPRRRRSVGQWPGDDRLRCAAGLDALDGACQVEGGAHRRILDLHANHPLELLDVLRRP